MRQYLYYQLFFIVLVWIPAIHSLDLMSDTWTATDGLGRSLPKEAKLPRQDRFVGVFYFLWLGLETSDGPFDISKVITANPDAMQQPNNTAWGPLYHYHHWGEPYFGYYRSTDQWVIR
ncbi:unnamed protein product, partial [Adineta steineri]